MKLSESLNSPLPYKWTKKNNFLRRAEFDVGGAKYGWKAMEGDMEGMWHVEFYIKNKDVDDIQGVTGTGNEFKVFATVAKITDEFLSDVKPKSIVFSAKEASRQKLYIRFAKKLASKYNMEVRTKPSSKGMSFTLFSKPAKLKL